MGEALKIYTEIAAPDVKIALVSTRMLSILGTLTFNTEWKSMSTLMGHYERHGEEGSPEEANRLLGAPRTTLKGWCEKKPEVVSKQDLPLSSRPRPLR